MRLYISLYYRQILITSGLGILLCWALTASIALSRTKPQFHIVLASADGVTLLTEEKADNEPIFLRNFLYAYVGYCYNYSLSTFDQNISKCGDLMSEKLWHSRQDEITTTARSLKTEAFVQSTSIVGDPRMQDDIIVLTVLSTRFEKKETLNIRVRIKLTAKRIPFRKENMFGYEVTSVEENPI